MEEVILVAGVSNGCNTAFNWKANEEDHTPIGIGDYAIVENMNGYDLIKIVGFVTTTKDFAYKISNKKYENMKRVIKYLKREEIEVQNENRN